jgi:hypothetical protein
MRMHTVATRRFIARDAVVAACRPVAATSPAATPAAATAAPSIRVVSYNILANKYAITGYVVAVLVMHLASSKHV